MKDNLNRYYDSDTLGYGWDYCTKCNKIIEGYDVFHFNPQREIEADNMFCSIDCLEKQLTDDGVLPVATSIVDNNIKLAEKKEK